MQTWLPWGCDLSPEEASSRQACPRASLQKQEAASPCRSTCLPTSVPPQLVSSAEGRTEAGPGWSTLGSGEIFWQRHVAVGDSPGGALWATESVASRVLGRHGCGGRLLAGFTRLQRLIPASWVGSSRVNSCSPRSPGRSRREPPRLRCVVVRCPRAAVLQARRGHVTGSLNRPCISCTDLGGLRAPPARDARQGHGLILSCRAVC